MPSFSRGRSRGPLIVTDLELVRAALERPDCTPPIAREPLAPPRDAPLERAVAMIAKQYVAHLLAPIRSRVDPAGIISSFDVAAVVRGQDRSTHDAAPGLRRRR